MNTLDSFGWNSDWQLALRNLEPANLIPARVIADSREIFICIAAAGEIIVRASGRLRHEAALPVTGDWVGLDWNQRDASAIIRAVLPRRTALARRAAGGRLRDDVLAANIDRILVVTSVGRDLNPRRIERYLMLATAAGISATIVVNKADLAPDFESLVRPLAPAIRGVPLVGVSARTGFGLAALERWLPPGHTVALVGSSGVGKSTLANRFLDGPRLTTSGVRPGDGRGRHTTTRRQLLRISTGALLLDTPGLREVGLVGNADPGMAFEEIESIGRGCRFRDCRHEREPGCAVAQAVSAGIVSSERLESLAKLRREADYANRRGDRAAESKKRKRDAKIHREIRKQRQSRA